MYLVETVAAATAIMAARAPPPTNEEMSNVEEKRHGAKILAALRRVEPGGYGGSAY